jgi:hypothetical protein
LVQNFVNKICVIRNVDNNQTLAVIGVELLHPSNSLYPPANFDDFAKSQNGCVKNDPLSRPTVE